MKGGDVQTAYLLADQIRPCYVWPASHMDYLFADDDVLANLRRKLKQKVREQGPQYIKKLNRKNKFKQHKVLRLLRAVYGTPDAGFAFQLLKDYAFEQAGAKRLFTDSAVYYIQEPASNSQCTEDGLCNDRWFILFSHTDDFGYFGSDDAFEEECKRRIEKHLKMEWEEELTDYTSVQYKQCTDRGLCELSQPKYWEQLAREFDIDIESCKTFVPLPMSCEFEESTPEKHEAAKRKGVKYLELVGALIYPSTVCKLELKYSVSLLGSHMHDYTEQHYEWALHVLKYGLAHYSEILATKNPT